MVHKICELCKTRTSIKWKRLTINLAQDVLDIFSIQLSLGKFNCNACQVKVTKEKKKKSKLISLFQQINHQYREETKTLSPKSILNKTRLDNLKEKPVLFGNINLPAIVLQQIISFLDIKSILNFSPSWKTVTKVMSQGF